MRHDVDDNFFSSLNSQSAWLLGLLAADGCIEGNRKRWILSQSGDHGLDIIKEVSGLISFGGVIHRGQPKVGNTYHYIRVSSSQMVSDMSAYGIVPAKTLTYSMPDIPAEFSADFMRGYIDGDGSIGVYEVNNYPALVLSLVGTKSFVDSVKEIVPAKASLSDKGSIWDIRWYGRNAVDACEWVYGNDELPRTKKFLVWEEYQNTLAADPPRWYSVKKRKRVIADLIGQGFTAKEIIKRTGEDYRIAYKWIKEFS